MFLYIKQSPSTHKGASHHQTPLLGEFRTSQLSDYPDATCHTIKEAIYVRHGDKGDPPGMEPALFFSFLFIFPTYITS